MKKAIKPKKQKGNVKAKAARISNQEVSEMRSLMYHTYGVLGDLLERSTHASEVAASREQTIVAVTHARRLIEEKKALGERIAALENQARNCHWCREYV